MGVLVVAACGGKDGTTDVSGSTGGTTEGTSMGTSAADTTEPTSAGTTAPTSGDMCEGDGCGVGVEMVNALCDENDPSMVPPTLTATSPAAGTIDVSEAGYEASCCLTFEPDLTVAGLTIDVVYTPVGDPCDCICYYALDYQITGLASGTWTIVSGAQSVDVEVQ